nr:hypothetical protein MIMGU_mgv11b008018mg [Ipomoea batatas]
MQAPAFPFEVVAAEAVLVPPVIHRHYVPGQDEQERRQRAQMVDLLLLLHLHPVLHFLELQDVVHHDEIGVEINDAFDVGGENVDEIGPGVVQGLVQRLADRLRDQAPDPGGVEAVNLEVEIGKRGLDAGEDVGVVSEPEEMEDDVFGAGGVLEDGEDGGHGAADVVGVEGHDDVDEIGRGGGKTTVLHTDFVLDVIPEVGIYISCK